MGEDQVCGVKLLAKLLTPRTPPGATTAMADTCSHGIPLKPLMMSWIAARPIGNWHQGPLDHLNKRAAFFACRRKPPKYNVFVTILAEPLPRSVQCFMNAFLRLSVAPELSRASIRVIAVPAGS